MGHASLMRPDRPLPTRLSVLSAATPQPEHRYGDYRGLGTPVASRLRLYMAQSLSGELHPDHEIVCTRRSIVNDSVLTNCFEFQ